MSDFQLGCLDAQFPVRLGALHTYGTLAPASAIYTGPPDGKFNYGVLGNNKYGDCTFAGFVHLFQAICLILGITPPAPTDAMVVQAYLTFTHGKDSGAVISIVLQTLRTTGLLGLQAFNYAPGQRDLSELWQMTETFGVTYLGVAVPAPAQGQFAAGEPWDLTGTSADNEIEGGHCIVGASFNQNTEMAEVITWGRRQPVTFRWMDKYLSEKWAVLTDDEKNKGALGDFNIAQLSTDLNSL